MQRTDLQQDSWDWYLRGASNSAGDYGQQGHQSHSVAFRRSAELGWVGVLFATDIICRWTLTSWIFIRLAVYMEYGIRFPLTGGELHYVSRVLWSNMLLLLSLKPLNAMLAWTRFGGLTFKGFAYQLC